MTSSATRRASILALVSVLVARPCSAQAPRSPASATECATAIATVEEFATKPHMPEEPEEAQLWTATRCGARGGAALAKLVPLARTATDVSSFIMAEAMATNLTDSTIARAFLQLASDNDASPEARIFAFRVLMHLRSPSTGLDAPQS